MRSTDDKDLVVLELLKEVRILKRQLGLIKNDITLISKGDMKKINIALDLLQKEIGKVKERSISI